MYLQPSKLATNTFVCLLLLILPGFASALESDKFQPIDISADNAILDDKAGKAIYRGNVELTQGTLKIIADQLTIEAGAEGRVEKVIAKGNLASFTQLPSPNEKPIEAVANTVEYYVTREKIVLIEKARVVQNENLFEGNIIEYDIKEQKLQAHGKKVKPETGGEAQDSGRVKMILQPQTEATAPAEDTADKQNTDEQNADTPEQSPTPNQQHDSNNE